MRRQALLKLGKSGFLYSMYTLKVELGCAERPIVDF